ncbi:hypothetical protein NEOCIP111885_04112 [Pseudoneobacillus rhizosphaerae]|uniref:Sulfurtransferase n=2 Tax=Pseudoneobacillus rhizosphaerae TaxID=2880968 RepID=A0A9C7LCS1_9BACI|nr:hypothetical protein NEOCIP111885_04112 [Pseudoneobacillus rhizosphaerae]
MIYILTLCIVTILILRRYFPVIGLKCMKWGEIDIKNITVMDVRDYNDSYKVPIQGAVNIPIAYLNRFYAEIPNRVLYIVASNSVEKNMGVRILRKKGFRIIGCSILSHEYKLLNNKRNTLSNC